jgi:hypothetical protein
MYKFASYDFKRFFLRRLKINLKKNLLKTISYYI